MAPVQVSAAPTASPAAPVQASAATDQGIASASSGQGAQNGASQNSAGQSLLTATYVPSHSTAGGTYKVIEKDTGQVVVELPREVTLSSGAASSGDGVPSAGVDLTA
ncbi:MAG: hypothetical protein JO303_07855 [Caulobacteraceae bacterium]|nr:hypothetical protein [Caulobacteraceae bacterium]